MHFIGFLFVCLNFSTVICLTNFKNSNFIMKKLFLAIAFIIAGLTIQAQESRFGVEAGVINANAKLEAGGNSTSGSETGFFFGLIGDFELSEEMHLQPGLLYTNVDDVSFLQIPVMAKYYVAEKFNIQAGPQVTYTLEKVADDFTKFNIALGLGLGYDFNDNFFIESRYHFQLNNYYTGSADLKSKLNVFNVGVGYKFN